MESGSEGFWSRTVFVRTGVVLVIVTMMRQACDRFEHSNRSWLAQLCREYTVDEVAYDASADRWRCRLSGVILATRLGEPRAPDAKGPLCGDNGGRTSRDAPCKLKGNTCGRCARHPGPRYQYTHALGSRVDGLEILIPRRLSGTVSWSALWLAVPCSLSPTTAATTTNATVGTVATVSTVGSTAPSQAAPSSVLALDLVDANASVTLVSPDTVWDAIMDDIYRVLRISRTGHPNHADRANHARHAGPHSYNSVKPVNSGCHDTRYIQPHHADGYHDHSPGRDGRK